MKIRAAVLEEFGQPLVVQDVELAGPKAGEVLVRLEACGVCHTDLYTASGADPTGYAPCVLGHEGAGVVEDVGEGVTSVRRGDRVITLFAPECGKCIHCLSPRTNRCIAIREQQGLGYLPDGTSRLSRGDELLRHFMGTSTFAEATVMPEIALAKVGAGRARRGCEHLRLRALDRPRRGLLHRPGRGGLDLRRVRLRPRRPRRRGGLPAARGRADRGHRPLGGAPGDGAPPRRDAHDARGRRRRRRSARADRRLRLRLHLRGHGQRPGHAPGRRVGARGLGARDDDRRRRQGRGARDRAALPDHGPPRHRARPSAASRAAARCRASCSCGWTGSSTWTACSATACRWPT